MTAALGTAICCAKAQHAIQQVRLVVKASLTIASTAAGSRDQADAFSLSICLAACCETLLCAGGHLVMGKALLKVIQLALVGVVEEVLLDCPPCVDLGLHSGKDAVKDPRNAYEEGRLHLACTDICHLSVRRPVASAA